jgi:hypothetical protein
MIQGTGNRAPQRDPNLISGIWYIVSDHKIQPVGKTNHQSLGPSCRFRLYSFDSDSSSS